MQQQLKDKLQAIANEVVQILVKKDDAYGSSWKGHGGFSAFFNLHRKYSRVENMAAEFKYDLFEAMRTYPDGPDSLKDLVGYALLTLSETHPLDHDLLVEQFLPPNVGGCGAHVNSAYCGKMALCPECWSTDIEDAAHAIETMEIRDNKKEEDDGAGPEYVNQDRIGDTPMRGVEEPKKGGDYS